MHLQGFVLFDESLGACGQDLSYPLPFSLLIVISCNHIICLQNKNLDVSLFQYINQIPEVKVLKEVCLLHL